LATRHDKKKQSTEFGWQLGMTKNQSTEFLGNSAEQREKSFTSTIHHGCEAGPKEFHSKFVGVMKQWNKKRFIIEFYLGRWPSRSNEQCQKTKNNPRSSA
jgi:hypothetical protein